MRNLVTTALFLTAAGLAGCMHVKGVVLEDPSNKPLKTAILSVGRPDGIAVFAKYHVDQNGRFDFYIGPGDEADVYVYDGANDPDLSMRQIEPRELNEKMTLHIRVGKTGEPMIPGGLDIR